MAISYSGRQSAPVKVNPVPRVPPLDLVRELEHERLVDFLDQFADGVYAEDPPALTIQRKF